MLPVKERPIGAAMPAVRVFDRGKLKSAGGRESNSRATFDLRLDPIQSPIGHRVFKSRMFTVSAISEITLRKHDGFADFVNMMGGDETDDLSELGKSLQIAMAHTHAATERHVVSDES